MITNTITFFLENTSIIAFVLAILLGIIGYIRRTKNKEIHVWEPLEFWMLFLFVGLLGIYTFALHCFWPDFAAKVSAGQTVHFNGK